MGALLGLAKGGLSAEGIVKLARFLYGAAATFMLAAFYSGWRNTRDTGSASKPDADISAIGKEVSEPASSIGTTDTGGPAGPLGPGGLQPPTAVGTVRGKGTVTIAQGAMRAGTTLDPGLVSFLQTMSSIVGIPLTVGTGTNHNQFVAGTNRVSDHWPDARGVGHAADLPFNAKTVPGRQNGDRVAAAAMIAAGLDAATAHANATKGGVYNIVWRGHRIQVLWKTLVGGNHFTHVHVGFR